ncbi:MAG: dUTP diphosphatase [Treponema sp.]|nr:dUTP diphosphatase [Candidatus Treponema merdequi]
MLIKTKLFGNGKLPEYKTKGAACADCYARLEAAKIKIPMGSNCVINLGFGLELPEGYEAVIRPRSGLSKDVLAVEGTIDCDYRGEIKARLYNYSQGDFIVKNGDRICQMKIQKAEQFEFVAVDELSETERGTKGFGSTGK